LCVSDDDIYLGCCRNIFVLFVCDHFVVVIVNLLSWFVSYVGCFVDSFEWWWWGYCVNWTFCSELVVLIHCMIVQ